MEALGLCVQQTMPLPPHCLDATRITVSADGVFVAMETLFDVYIFTLCPWQCVFELCAHAFDYNNSIWDFVWTSCAPNRLILANDETAVHAWDVDAAEADWKSYVALDAEQFKNLCLDTLDDDLAVMTAKPLDGMEWARCICRVTIYCLKSTAVLCQINNTSLALNGMLAFVAPHRIAILWDSFCDGVSSVTLYDTRSGESLRMVSIPFIIRSMHSFALLGQWPDGTRAIAMMHPYADWVLPHAFCDDALPVSVHVARARTYAVQRKQFMVWALPGTPLLTPNPGTILKPKCPDEYLKFF